MITLSWAQIRDYAVNNDCELKYVEDSASYNIFVMDGSVTFTCRIDKNPTDTTDLNEFETSYKTTNLKLYVSELVPTATESYSTFTPSVGQKVKVHSFIGDAAFSKNSVVKLLWKYGDVDEVAIWTIKGSHEVFMEIDIPDGEIDGVRKIAVACENGESGDLYMSGLAVLEVTSG